MPHAVPFAEVTDLYGLADDLAGWLMMPSNADIAEEFPSTVQRYTGPDAAQHLAESKGRWELGIREQFVIFSGNRAVGMAHAALTDDVPEGIDPSYANFSAFVCNPYRQQGLGKLLAQSCIEAVDAHFAGKAWTTTSKENVASQQMVAGVGFALLGETNFHGKTSNLYTYIGATL